jgi:hypothetical protein
MGVNCSETNSNHHNSKSGFAEDRNYDRQVQEMSTIADSGNFMVACIVSKKKTNKVESSKVVISENLNRPNRH